MKQTTTIYRHYLTWEQVESAIDNIAKQLKDSKLPIASIYGIPRGGLIPAVMLSHKLGLPITRNLEKNALVVDDICDSGETIKHHMSLGYSVATILYKLSAEVKPTFYFEIAREDAWYVYPWETKDSNPIQDYLT